MPRYARIHMTGGLFHVISRFHNNDFFLDFPGARQQYLALLGKALDTHDCRLIAYCLMSSHVHLVLQLGNDPLGALTRRVHSPFAVWLNSQRGGLGTVFAGRPRSVLVHSDTYGMELVRYVHNNPVRAGVVSRAVESEWSSHRAYMGLAEAPSWLSMEALFGDNKRQQDRIRKELDAFVDEGRFEGRRADLDGEVSRALSKRMNKMMGGEVTFSYPVLGPDAFVRSAMKEQVATQQGRLGISVKSISIAEVTATIFNELAIRPQLAFCRGCSHRVSRGRALASWVWVEQLGQRQVDLASVFNVRPATISCALSKIRREGMTESEKTAVENAMSILAAQSKNECTAVDTNISAIEPMVLALRRDRTKTIAKN
ncbi:MAG: transposase [Deltaproteobacteria bacterium]|nr:transposase [Deltaproteobacteria bacterium]MBN2671582.1 transposase [Deltaproteobacteria bacterium]